MSERVDELFGASGSEARPRVALVISLCVGGLLVTLAGMACSVIPGVLVVLLAWVVVQRDLDRVDSGFLPLTDRSRLLVLRGVVWSVVVVAALLTVVQLAGLWTGTYQAFWDFLLRSIPRSQAP
jgi:hypothetical protein